MRKMPETMTAALIGLSLAACGGSNAGEGNRSSTGGDNAATASSAAGTDPCSLVTTEEVAAAIGDKIVIKTSGDGACQYQTEDAQASTVTIELNQTDAKGQMDIARTAAGILKDMGGAVADQGGAGADVNAALSESGDTPKIGDEALFGSNQQLSVRKGNSYLAISPPMMRSRMSGGNPMLSDETKKAMALAIAEKAVARLP